MLEHRTLLEAGGTLVAGLVVNDLVITEMGGDIEDVLTISTDGTNLTISDANWLGREQ